MICNINQYIDTHEKWASVEDIDLTENPTSTRLQTGINININIDKIAFAKLIR
jgi:hypothetical protein